MKKYLVYDCEIVKCIPPEQNPRYTYCKGWQDFENMGISVIGCFVSWENKIKVFPETAFNRFQMLVNQADEIVGFNSVSFDDNLCKANGINIVTTYDILEHIRVAAGMPPKYTPGVTRGGYSLNAIAKANLGKEKSGSGALAPQLWQDGKRFSVIDYLVDDVLLTTAIYKRIINQGRLIDPTDNSRLTFDRLA